jgi:hypothetical protein
MFSFTLAGRQKSMFESVRGSHSGLGDALVVLEALIVVNLVGMVRLVLPALQNRQQALPSMS